MDEQRMAFLRRLLSTPGPSGDERAVARIWREEASRYADEVSVDILGNSYATLRGGPLRIMLTGHIDEIGLMISHVDEQGFLYFKPIGSWDEPVLIGQRVRLVGAAGEVVGAIGRPAQHVLRYEDESRFKGIDKLWIDIGTSSRAETLELVPVGSVGVLDAPIYELPGGRLLSRSLDDRIGAFVVLEALRQLAAERPAATVIVMAAAHEEISSVGAGVAAYRSEPAIALVVDVAQATDHPDANLRQYGDVRLGGGPVLSRGAANQALVVERLRAVAKQESIPYSLQMTPQITETDADMIYLARGGVATAVVGLPTRYMHSPNEIVDLADAAHAARLLAAFVRSVESVDEFLPQ